MIWTEKEKNIYDWFRQNDRDAQLASTVLMHTFISAEFYFYFDQHAYDCLKFSTFHVSCRIKSFCFKCTNIRYTMQLLQLTFLKCGSTKKNVAISRHTPVTNHNYQITFVSVKSLAFSFWISIITFYL